MSEGTLCQKQQFDRTISSFSHLSVYQEIGFVNNSTKSIYVGTSYGDKPIVLEPARLMTSPTNTITIYIRMTNGNARKFNGSEEIAPKEGLLVNIIEIPVLQILSQEYFYLEELDLCFCMDPNKISLYHKKLNKNIDKRVRAEIDIALKANNSSPVKIFGNDASGTFNLVWVCVNKLLSCCEISNERDTGSYMRVSIGTPSGKYNDYDVDIDKIRKGEIVEVVTDTGVIALGPSEPAMRNWLFKQDNHDGTNFTRAQITTLISQAVEDKQRELDLIKFELSDTKSKLKLALEDLKIEKNKNEKIQDRELEELKRTLEREKRDFEREKLDHEREKLKRDLEMKKVDRTNDIILGIIKVATASIPLALAVYAALKKVQS